MQFVHLDGPTQSGRLEGQSEPHDSTLLGDLAMSLKFVKKALRMALVAIEAQSEGMGQIRRPKVTGHTGLM